MSDYIRRPRVKPSDRASSPEWEAKQAAKAKKKTPPAKGSSRKGPRKGILVEMKKIVDETKQPPRPSPIAELLSGFLQPPPSAQSRDSRDMIFGLGFLLLGALFMSRVGDLPHLRAFPADESEPEFQDFLPEV
jgi:hypothetical protein